MRVLVTGGTGFVGLAVAEALRARRHEVTLFGASPVPEACARDFAIAGCRVIVGDIRSPHDIAAALDHGVDAIVHGAAITPSPDMEATRPAEVLKVNLQGTLDLISQAKAAGIRRIVILSSVAAYGHAKRFGEATLHEDRTPPAPTTLYGISKLSAEQVAFRMCDLWGLTVRVIRLGPIFGPWEYSTGMRELSAHCQAIDQALAGEECRLEREMYGDYLYSRAAAGAIVQVVERKDAARRLYNLGGPVSSVADWCQALAQRIPGFRWKIDPPNPTIRPWLAYDRAVLDSNAFSNEFGFQATSLGDGAVDESILWRRKASGF